MKRRKSVETQKTILLVEDEVLIALMETQQLESEGYHVIHALSGEEAIERLCVQKEAAGLVLMDIDLGEGMDGTETAREILKTQDLPLVFLSSHMEKEIVERTEKITSYGYVVKNLNITVLDASIKMAFKLFNAHLSIQNQKMDMEAAYEEMQTANEELLRAQSDLIERETELTNMNADLRKTRILMQAAFDQSPVPLVVVTYPETGLAPANALQKAMQSGSAADWTAPLFLTAKNGARRRTTDKAAPIKKENGTSAGGVLVFREL